MNTGTLQRRSLTFHWRANLAVTLGVAVAGAILTGALVVGDSMQASLRAIAVDRLGSVDYALVTTRFVRQQLAADIAADGTFAETFDSAVPAVLLTGSVTHAASKSLVGRANIYGVNSAFLQNVPATAADPNVPLSGRDAVLNASLAEELGAKAGDDVLVRVGRATEISPETLLGRRDRTSAGMRVTVSSVIPDDGVGSFALRPDQRRTRNAFIPLELAQRLLDQPRRVNAVLVTGASNSSSKGENDARPALARLLQKHTTLADLQLRLRDDPRRGYVSLETERFLLEPPIENAAAQTANELGLASTAILTYLANSIFIEATAPSNDAPTTGSRPNRQSIPYSTVAGFDSLAGASTPLMLTSQQPLREVQPGTIVLNEWAANALGAQSGDRVVLAYYTVGKFGALQTKRATFELAGIVRMDPAATDPGWSPEYPGVTDADTIAAWDPPFPVDLDKVTGDDEQYWQKYRAAPKAFVALRDAQDLWVNQADRFGSLTAIRFYPPSGADLAQTAPKLEDALLHTAPLEALGLRFSPLKAQAIEASTGSTDFGMLFIGFSFFLIVSALMLVALLFRLNVERRAAEIGLLLAVGFPPRSVGKFLLIEGGLLVLVGGLYGLLGAVAFAWFMLEGLRSWWSAAVQTPLLHLDIAPDTVIIGLISTIVVALGAVAWALRGMVRLPARALLSGPAGAARLTQERPRNGRTARRGRTSSLVAVIALLGAAAAIAAPVWTNLNASIAFFSCGTAMLIAALASTSRWMQRPEPVIIHRPTRSAMPRLGVRNIPRNRGRSLLTIGLVASATFVIAAMEAFRIDVDQTATDRSSGTGGFTLLAESAAPITADLNTPSGRETVGLTGPSLPANMQFFPFRLREGDETSCLNLYKPTTPRILGATPAMIDRGGFTFAGHTADPAANDNPWTLLNQALEDGAIPVLGDEAAVLWQLHSGLGKTLTIIDERGREVRLRFVALLTGSVLQSELVISEHHFTELFPSLSGYRFFLIDAPADKTERVTETLERSLSAYGFDVSATAQRLRAYSAVQNTYLSTFQTLGGLGLVLGTLGLAVVLLRNVWERRAELALMRALGFSTSALGLMVLSENVALVVTGLLCGVIPAAVAVAPHALDRAATLPWASVGLTLLGVLIAGVAGGAVALFPTLRTPLLPALRTE